MTNKRKFSGPKTFKVQPIEPSILEAEKAPPPDKPAKPELVSDDGLLEAVQKGQAKRVQKLLSLGADVNAKDKWQITALMSASKNGYLGIVRDLVTRRARIEDYSGNSALVWAAWAGHLDIVKLLLEYGADVRALDENGNTALFDAARRGHAEVVKVLLEHGSHVHDSRNPSGNALTWAKQKGYQRITDMLTASLDQSTGPSINNLVSIEKRDIHNSLIQKVNHDYEAANALVYRSRAKLHYMNDERDEALRNYLIAQHLMLYYFKESLENNPAALAIISLIQMRPDKSTDYLAEVHPDAPLLLGDKIFVAHVGHAFIDLDRTAIPDGEMLQQRANYWAELNEDAYDGPTDEAKRGLAQDTSYLYAGMNYLAKNIAWDKLDSTEPADVALLYEHDGVNPSIDNLDSMKKQMALRQALIVLRLRSINLSWCSSPEPYAQLSQECEILANDTAFCKELTQYVTGSGNFRRALTIFFIGISRGQNSWSTVEPKLRRLEKQGYYAERWRYSFEILRGELGYFLTNHTGASPLFAEHRRQTINCPALEDVRQLLCTRDFVQLRNSFQHTNYAFEEASGIEHVVAYKTGGESESARFTLREAEAFHIVVCAVIDILMETFLVSYDPRTT